MSEKMRCADRCDVGMDKLPLTEEQKRLVCLRIKNGVYKRLFSEGLLSERQLSRLLNNDGVRRE